MGRKLDNWSFGLSLVGSIGVASIIPLTEFIYNSDFIYGWFKSLKMISLYRGIEGIVLLAPWFLVIIGFVIGITALIKGSEKKWKPILAIILSVIGFLLNTFLILMSGGGVGS